MVLRTNGVRGIYDKCREKGGKSFLYIFTTNVWGNIRPLKIKGGGRELKLISLINTHP